jgi:multidrug efflux pump subunit AcrB
MKGITAFALNNSRTVVMTILLVIVGGAMAFITLPKLEDPFITIREAVVTASYPGMPVAEVERLITRPIEEKIRSMGEVDKIKNSTSKYGECLIHVTISDDVPAEQLPATWKLLRNRMADVKPELPDGTIGPAWSTIPSAIRRWPPSHCGATDSTWRKCMKPPAKSGSASTCCREPRKSISPACRTSASIIEVSNAKITQLGIDPVEIGKRLKEQNILLPGGRINIDNVEIIVETQGRFASIEEIENVLIPIPASQASIPLRDIATIRKAYVEPIRNPAYFNGHPAIVLSVFIIRGVDAVEYGERLKQAVKAIEQSLPWGYVLDFATYQPDLINKSVNGMVLNVIESIAIVLVVVMLLLGLRTGLIVGSFIPLVMLFGLLMMSVLGIDLERMSLATMIIALGMFVDNAIVVSDDIKVNLETGMGRKEAVLKTGQSLSVPLLTSTLTTVFAFGPILLQIGTAGDYTASLGSVMIILLMGSWFFSMFSSTSMCYWFLKPPAAGGGDQTQKADPYQGKFYRLYRRILEFSLRYRTLVLAVTGGAFAAAIYAATFIPQAFFPGGDRNQYLIYLDLPAGTRIEETDRAVRQLSAWLQDKQENPEITGTIAYVGNGGPRFFLSLSPLDPDPFVGFLIVNTQTNKEVPALVQRTDQYLKNHFPNARGRVKSMWLGGSESGLFELRLSGPDIQGAAGTGRAGDGRAARHPRHHADQTGLEQPGVYGQGQCRSGPGPACGGDIPGCGQRPGVLCRRRDSHQLPPGQCRDPHRGSRGRSGTEFPRQPADARHPHLIRRQRAAQPGGRCDRCRRIEPHRALQSGAHHHRQRQKPGAESLGNLCRPEAHAGSDDISEKSLLARRRRTRGLRHGPEKPGKMAGAVFRRHRLSAGMAVQLHPAGIHHYPDHAAGHRRVRGRPGSDAGRFWLHGHPRAAGPGRVHREQRHRDDRQNRGEPARRADTL